MTSKTGDNIKKQSEGIGPTPFIRQMEKGSSSPYSIGRMASGNRRSPQGVWGSYINTVILFEMTWILRNTIRKAYTSSVFYERSPEGKDNCLVCISCQKY